MVMFTTLVVQSRTAYQKIMSRAKKKQPWSKKAHLRGTHSEKIFQTLICLSVICFLATVSLQLSATLPLFSEESYDHNNEISSIGHPNPNPHQNKRKIAIFYNTYVNPNNTVQGQEIINSQLKQINDSPSLPNSTIYYSRFGHLEEKWPMSTCLHNRSRDCIAITEKEKGDEVDTLQYLYEYCLNHVEERVVYMHTKGSFTNSSSNMALNRVLMKAITSDECLLKMDTNGTDCDTCSSQFLGYPACYTGNMFVADCDYISKLIPPIEFESRKSALVKKALSTVKPLGLKKIYTMQFDNITVRFRNSTMWQVERPSWVGTERYAMEYWIGSHPAMKPCDVFSPKNGNWPFSYTNIGSIEKKVMYKLKLEHAPGDLNWARNHTKKLVFKLGLHPWFGLKGTLYQYKALYSKEPPNSSWIYKIWEW